MQAASSRSHPGHIPKAPELCWHHVLQASSHRLNLCLRSCTETRGSISLGSGRDGGKGLMSSQRWNSKALTCSRSHCCTPIPGSRYTNTWGGSSQGQLPSEMMHLFPLWVTRKQLCIFWTHAEKPRMFSASASLRNFTMEAYYPETPSCESHAKSMTGLPLFQKVFSKSHWTGEFFLTAAC